MSVQQQQLNEAQKKAVTYGEGPLLIVAGAGTGKTTVITQRIAHLILDRGVRTDGVLALTFTEKAAEEMRERVDLALPMGYVDLWISTFHAFCEKLLQQHGLDIGLPNDCTLLNQTSQWLLVRQHLDRFNLSYYKPLGNPTKFIHGLLAHFSRCKDEEIYPEDYTKYAKTLEQKLKKQKKKDPLLTEEIGRIKEIASAYHTYQQLLLDTNALDFGDLINYTLRLFKTRKAILKKYQDQFSYILVDEFQDTNLAQYSLIKLLAGKKANITVVGDDDQSIYKFRGASVSNILQFKKDFKRVEEVVLTDNYRSAQDILDLSYNFIKLNNPNRLEAQRGSAIDKRLKGQAKGKADIEHLHFKTSDDEVRGVIKKLLELKEQDPELNWSDCAILVRANDSAKAFTNFLRKTQVPYHYVALKGLYSKNIILDIVNYFKLLDNYHESTALFRVLRSPIVHIDDADIAKLTHHARKKNISLYDCVIHPESVSGLSDHAKAQASFIVDLIRRHTALSREKTVGEILIAFMNDSKYLEKVIKLDEAEAKQQTDYINQFYARVKTFEESHPEPTLQNFMAELDLELESGEAGSLRLDPESGPDVIKIMTIHSAKGLEFDRVFIPTMVQQRFPTVHRSDPIEIPEPLIKDIVPEGDHHIEEERRLLYVAMTRAKKGLYFSSAEDYGGMRKKKPSQFLAELAQTNNSFKLSDAVQSEAEKAAPDAIPETAPHKGITYTMPKQFSFSQIAAFKTCPYQYKLGFIYKIPTLGKGQFSFGKSMHSALQQLYIVANERAAQGSGQTDLFAGTARAIGNTLGELVTEQELLDLLKDFWVDEWYESPQTRDDYWNKGIASLKAYYQLHKDNPVRTAYLEKGFVLKVTQDPNTPDAIYTIRGFIDRIDILPDGGAEIVDYKTGKPKDKLSFEEKTQLLLYQLAAQEIPEITGGHPVQKLTFYYLDNNSPLSFIGTDKELAQLKETIIDAIQRINTSKFEATPDSIKCTFCDFRNICEFKV